MNKSKHPNVSDHKLRKLSTIGRIWTDILMSVMDRHKVLTGVFDRYLLNNDIFTSFENIIRLLYTFHALCTCVRIFHTARTAYDILNVTDTPSVVDFPAGNMNTGSQDTFLPTLNSKTLRHHK